MSRSPNTHPMIGGDGRHSYMRNSSYQKATIDMAGEKTRQCILENLDLFKSNPNLTVFKIADLGCSTGPNTFCAVQNIIDAVNLKYLNSQNCQTPLEYQVFFNDQTYNDFNTLFRTQPPSSDHRYFSAGVPGSFRNRLFPRNSLHIGHTSSTIHWLSKVPDHVCDKNSPAWNKTYIQCNNLIQEVTNAYYLQFIKDTNDFLEARAKELVPGGLMIITGQCLLGSILMAETWLGIATDMMADCLMDMTKSGITSEEKIELFNLPIYIPHYSVVKKGIEENKRFSIEMMENIKHPMDDIPKQNDFIVSLLRSTLGTIIESHFGDGVVDELFHQLAKKLDKYPIDFKECKNITNYFILIKKI